MSRARAWPLPLAALLGCGDATAVVIDDSESETGSESGSGSETGSGSESETETESESGSETETGGEELPPADPCPADGCLCLTAQQVDEAPELGWPVRALHDLDNDGLVDKIRLPSITTDAEELFEVWFGLGPDSFAAESTLGPLLPADFAVSEVAVGDLDFDGALDLVVVGGPPSAHGIYFVPNTELWAPELIEHRTPTQQSYPSALSLAQLGSAAQPDVHGSALLLGEYWSLVEILTLGADGLSFEPRALLGTDLGPIELAVLDVDVDGASDVVTLDQAAEGLSIFRGVGDGFAPPIRLALPDAAELEPLPARGYALVRAGEQLYRLGWSGAGPTLELAGQPDPELVDATLHALDDGAALIAYDPGWQQDPTAFFSLCPNADESWARVAAPLWSTYGSFSVYYDYAIGDRNQDGLDDLSVDESLGEGRHLTWRFLQQ